MPKGAGSVYHRRRTCNATKGPLQGRTVQPVVDRKERQLQAVRHTDFVEDVRQVMLDGLLADRELLRDLLVLIRVNDCRHDLPLTHGQTEIRLPRRSSFENHSAAADRAHQVGHALPPDEVLAAMDDADALEQLRRA